MKLMFAIKSLNVVGGGAERVLVEVANGLAARGHDIVLLTFDGSGEAFYALHHKLLRVNLDVGLPGHPTPRWKLLRSLIQMNRLIRSVKPDLLVGFMHSMYIPLGLANIGTGIPMIASEHIGSGHYKNRPLQRIMVKMMNSLFVAKTVPSEEIRKEHPLKERSTVFALFNPVNLNAFSGIASVAPPEPPTIITVGRLMAQKNHTELIAAFAQLSQTYPEWRLRIVGDGELRGELDSEIRRLNLQNRIELVGATQNIAQEYQGATIVAVPSRYESFGMVTAEAQAAGRPVIGFADCPGTNELIINNENGLLVSGDGDRVANLAAGLQELMNDQLLRCRLGAAGPASVKKFSLERVLDSWESFFLGFLKSTKN